MNWERLVSRWFGHAWRRPTTVLMTKVFLCRLNGSGRKRGRPKRTWMEVVRVDMQKCNIFENLALHWLEWQNIHVANSNIVRTRLSWGWRWWLFNMIRVSVSWRLMVVCNNISLLAYFSPLPPSSFNLSHLDKFDKINKFPPYKCLKWTCENFWKFSLICILDTISKR